MLMLKFLILNAYSAGAKAGHAETQFDTTLADDVKAAEVEFTRLLGEGRTAVHDGLRVTQMPTTGKVSFLLPMQGG